MDLVKRQRTEAELATGSENVLTPVIDALRECADQSKLNRWDRVSESISMALFRTKGVPVGQELEQAVMQALAGLEESIRSLQRSITAHQPAPRYKPPRPWTRKEAEDVISYAHKLSYTTFAPAGFVLGTTPLHLHKPPGPQEAQLRSSQLHELDREWSKRKAAMIKETAQVAAASTAAKPAPVATEAALPGILHDLPPMPEGWKPGDPIPGVALEEPPPAESPPSTAEVAVPIPQPQPVLKSLNFVLNADFDPGQLEFGEGSSEEESDEDDEEEESF